MTSSEDLTFAFLETHPADAARVLERLAPASAAALLQSTPLRLVAPVLRQMLPISGARCLELLDDTETAGLLRGVGAQAGVALLRFLGAERRARLLAQLPTALTIAYDLLLGYPEGTVGAWMDPRALALPSDMTASESLERVRRADESLIADPYVIDRNQRLLGYVELADLLRANAGTPLTRLVRTSPHRLPAQSLLAGLRDHPGWREASALPVVDRGDRLVGAITHAALQRALATEQRISTPRHPGNTLSGIAGAYWFGVAALIQAVVGLLPDERSKGEP
ncbi:MAG: CBS domain-containing protein [Gammaproteobacteria bacterium]|nr:CBS domain-containing protein [Gammaproteobacteria bacterium]MBU1645297.1 CBS domain-containing protein [Gammaproteobacteria bacterium]MBU1972290.1 CBS domain-containing protein [Gammaproteobacteria bacterium]